MFFFLELLLHKTIQICEFPFCLLKAAQAPNTLRLAPVFIEAFELVVGVVDPVQQPSFVLLVDRVVGQVGVLVEVHLRVFHKKELLFVLVEVFPVVHFQALRLQAPSPDSAGSRIAFGSTADLGLRLCAVQICRKNPVL